MARARMTRSELKARDEITTTLERLTETAMARKNEILIGAADCAGARWGRSLAGGITAPAAMPQPKGNSQTSFPPFRIPQ